MNPIIRFRCEWAPIQTKRPKPHYACFSPKHGPVNSTGHPFFYLLKEINGFVAFKKKRRNPICKYYFKK
jgi:hypothetical protein